MTTSLKAVSARTKYKNTPESDEELYVIHVVQDQFGNEHDISATDPLDAITKFNSLTGK